MLLFALNIMFFCFPTTIVRIGSFVASFSYIPFDSSLYGSFVLVNELEESPYLQCVEIMGVSSSHVFCGFSVPFVRVFVLCFHLCFDTLYVFGFVFLLVGGFLVDH
jgi:hypothetical protein